MRPLFTARVAVWHEKRARDTLVIFNAALKIDDLHLASVLRSDLEENLEPDDVLIIVNDGSFADAYALLNSSPYISQAIDRYRVGVKMVLVGFDGSGNDVRRCPLRNDIPVSDIPLPAVIRPTMTRIFRHRQGFVQGSPNYHFENPSGKHTMRFIRLSNMISAQSEISFMAFCLLPSVAKECEVVYTDTPAVFPLMASVNEHRRLASIGYPFVATENFSSYAVIENKIKLRATRSAVLISASSSGSLARDIHQRRAYPKSQIWHILFAGPNSSDHQIIGDLNFDEEHNQEGIRNTSSDYRSGACVYCESGSFPIPLKGDQFELPGPQLDAIQLMKTDEPSGLRQTIGRYAGNQVFGIGMGARQSGYARQYNVDTAQLVTVDEFMHSLRYIIRRSVPYGCEHIIYLDKPSLSLAEEARDLVEAGTGNKVALLGRDELDQLPKASDSPVAVIAAAVESGRSLLDLSRDLRSICTEGAIIYIIGVSKTNGSVRREELEVNLAMADRPVRHEVTTSEKILLPVSAEGHAWHREREMLARLRGTGSVPDQLLQLVDERLALLRNETTVLLNNLFWSNDESAPMKVQPGFVFADRRSVGRYVQADVYFTVSSVVQKLRAAGANTTSARGIRSNWFQQTLLSPGNFGRFNDGAIQASLLRAASPRELNYSGDEELSREAGHIVSRIVRSARETRGEAAAEFLIALATKSLLLRAADRQIILDAVPPDLPRLTLLKDAAQLFGS